MRIIDNQEQFDRLCVDLPKEPIIFMDTEFCRRRTYYAKLSLVQIATRDQKIIVDVMSGINIQPLNELLLNENVCKVFHAPEQDLDIFYHLFGKLPKNIFDTQIAAGVIGLDAVMGYGKLCKAILNVNLDKTMQKANWLERPLSESLLEYAIRDVEYLIPLYRELTNTIDSRNLWDTYKTRSNKLLDPNTYKINFDKIIKKAGIQNRSEEFKEKYRYLAMLREQCAQRENLPRNRCASDYDLVKICEFLPITDKDLLKLHIERVPIARKHFKDKLFELCLGLREQYK
ncbi:MAG: ribonuclease D [Rickettsiaceae bacterium]